MRLRGRNPFLRGITVFAFMAYSLNIQTLGATVVIGAFAASEAVAGLLSIYPSSPWAWYLNLEVFRPFEYARVEACPLRFLFGPASLSVALGLLALTLVLRMLRHRFGVAAAANLSFMFALALGYEWIKGTTTYDAASLAPAAYPGTYDYILLGLMLVPSFIAVAASHTSFIAAMLAQAPSARRA